MKSKFTRYILALLLISYLSVGLLFANIDSILNSINQQEGKSRLEAYKNACNRAASQYNIKEEMLLLSNYKIESALQGNTEHQTQALTLRLYAYYNNNLPDSLNLYINESLDFMKKHKEWTAYYSCRSLIVERYLYDKKIHSALRESKSMYDFACKNNTPYGRGVSAYLIGSCYQSMDRHKDAIDFFRKAEVDLLKEGNVGQTHNLYGMAWQSFSRVGNSDKQLELTNRWDAMWTEYCKKNDLELSTIAPYYVVCLMARVDAYLAKKEFSLARKNLDISQGLSQGQRDISKLLLLKYEALYAESVGNYQESLKYLNKRYDIQLKLNNELSALDTQEIRARVLSKLGRHKESSAIYEVLLPQKDSLTMADMAIQLDDLGTNYNINNLKLEKAELKLWRNISFCISIALILLSASYIYYQFRLKAKNKVIYKHIQAQNKMNERAELLAQNIPLENQSSNEVIFNKIKKVLQDPDVISDYTLERNKLAQLLYTNSSYIAAAIKSESGMKVSEYINKSRIDYACLLLKDDEISDDFRIWEKCGFSSRSTFYRTFKERTGMSPKNYIETTNM